MHTADKGGNTMKRATAIRILKNRRSTRQQDNRATSTEVTTLKIEPQHFIEADFQGRREIARKCFAVEDLHYHASHAIDSVDARIVRDLRAVIGKNIGPDLGDECG